MWPEVILLVIPLLVLLRQCSGQPLFSFLSWNVFILTYYNLDYMDLKLYLFYRMWPCGEELEEATYVTQGGHRLGGSNWREEEEYELDELRPKSKKEEPHVRPMLRHTNKESV
jgi:hypothetical protein